MSTVIFGLLMGSALLIGRVLPTKQLAYISYDNNRSDLILLDLYHRIPVDLAPQAFVPSWLPDGNQIAFFAYVNGGPPDLYIMDVLSGRIRPLMKNALINSSPSWSPDGREMVFASLYDRSYGLYRTSVDCTDSIERCAKRLTPKDNFIYTSPAWSPDGQWIAFVSNMNDHVGRMNIFVMKPDGSDFRRLASTTNTANPAWSPDSHQLVYAAQDAKLNATALMIVDINCPSTNPCIRKLFGDSLDTMPAWSPDGYSIVFADAQNGSYEIYLTDTEGRYLQRLTYNNTDEISPQWRP